MSRREKEENRRRRKSKRFVEVLDKFIKGNIKKEEKVKEVKGRASKKK